MMDKDNVKLTENENAALANQEPQILTDEELKDVAGGTFGIMMGNKFCAKHRTPESCNGDKVIACKWVDKKCVFTI